MGRRRPSDIASLYIYINLIKNQFSEMSFIYLPIGKMIRFLPSDQLLLLHISMKIFIIPSYHHCHGFGWQLYRDSEVLCIKITSFRQRLEHCFLRLETNEIYHFLLVTMR